MISLQRLLVNENNCAMRAEPPDQTISFPAGNPVWKSNDLCRKTGWKLIGISMLSQNRKYGFFASTRGSPRVEQTLSVESLSFPHH
jgi:hypothetical protein